MQIRVLLYKLSCNYSLAGGTDWHTMKEYSVDPPDGGYGWVVVISALFSRGLTTAVLKNLPVFPGDSELLWRPHQHCIMGHIHQHCYVSSGRWAGVKACASCIYVKFFSKRVKDGVAIPKHSLRFKVQEHSTSHWNSLFKNDCFAVSNKNILAFTMFITHTHKVIQKLDCAHIIWFVDLI